MSIKGVESVSNNNHITEYLEYYLSMSSAPRYAVFIDGEWGSGKTWFIKKFISENQARKYLYASLYGVSSVSQIEDQFFQQLHPWLSSKPFSIGAKIAKSALKATLKLDFDEVVGQEASVDVGVPDLKIQDLLADSDQRILVIDDLERCSDNLAEILGYVNQLVEHQGHKLIMLGHRKEIRELDAFEKKNEKLIGRTFAIHSDVKNAFETFCNNLQYDDVKELLKRNAEVVEKVYERSLSKNLRTLKYSTNEYARFFSLFPEKAKLHAEFQSACIDSFFSICAELRADVITVEDIHGLAASYTSYRVKQSLNKKESSEPSAAAGAYLRHFDFSSQIFPNEESLFFFFKFGMVPEKILVDSIDTCRFFVNNDTPTWAKLWHIHSLSEAELAKFYTEIKADFSGLKIVDQGVIRHVVAMILAYSKDNLTDMSYSVAVDFVNEIVRQLIDGKLISLTDEEESYPRFNDAYGGLGFTSKEDPNFQGISKKLFEYQKQLREEKANISASSLIDLDNFSSESFLKLLRDQDGVSKQVRKYPVLKDLPVDRFVDAIIKTAPADLGRLKVGFAFKERYQFIPGYPLLIQELPWLKNLNDEIERRLPGLGQPTKYQLTCIKERYLAEAITNIEGFVAGQNSNVTE